ncbi:MAG: tRNA (adenosine(37)-N6)-dimethylallyltransferase MiaA [Gemmataceae bacterium]
MPSELFRDAFVLTGPTGSGKSAFALPLAERLGAEIVSMDSMTLYRGMDVGTAKPSPEDRRRMPHHLIDVLDPWESASVAWWRDRAAECCRDIAARGRRVLFVGGTPLYLKALLYGLFEGPPAIPELRRSLETEARETGSEELHRRLAAVDPETARRLHPNDLRRIVRALEVWESTGRPISDWQQQWARPANVLASCWWIDRPRAELYARIDNRVNQMLEAGWLEEARTLRESAKPLGREAGQALGYAELFAYLDGRLTLAEAAERIQIRSRQFAKRQLTWFRGLPECRPVPVSGDAIPDFADLTNGA